MTNASRIGRPRAVQLLFLVALLLLPDTAFAQARPVVTVSTASDFLKAIGPNRVIQLKKGDYLLSSAYQVKNRYVSWYESDEGKELSLSGLSGLTIRGVPGSRIVVDTPTAYILDLEDSEGITFDTLVFVRKVGEEDEVSAGGLYLGGSSDLVLSQVSFEGVNGYPLELAGASGVTVRQSTFSGGLYGAVYATDSSELSFEGSTFSDNEGYPLVYLEESSFVEFSDCDFLDNYGSTLIELYAESGEAEGIVFTGCGFSGNEFDYFSGPGPLPDTLDCLFDGNSFDEDWYDYAVAPESDDWYDGSGEEAWESWYFTGTGLMASYPSWWYAQEGEEEGQAVFSNDDGSVMAVFTGLPTRVGKDIQLSRAAAVFEAASTDLGTLFLTEAEVAFDLVDLGDPVMDGNGLLSAWASGLASSAEESKPFRIRFAISGARVYALVVFADDETMLQPDSEAGAFLESLVYGE